VLEYSFGKNICKYKEDKVRGEIDKIIKKTPKFVLFSYFYCLIFWLFNGDFQLPNLII
jgi:hypothetical protein